MYIVNLQQDDMTSGNWKLCCNFAFRSTHQAQMNASKYIAVYLLHANK